MSQGSAAHLLACASMVPTLFSLERSVVHVHNPVVYRYLRPSLIAARARVVVHFHIEPGREDIWYSLKDPPHHVVACARYIAKKIEDVLRERGSAVPVSAVPNSIDLARFTPGSASEARERIGLTTARFVILMMANLAAHKGQVTALRALSRLKSRELPVECWLVGEDRSAGREYEQELRTLCSHLGLDDCVRFLGFRSDAPELLRAADVFLLPSTHEGLPLSVLEAQAAGIPVVGSTIPGITEVVDDGRTGFIVPADDDAGYAARIQTLLEQPELRRNITTAAAETVAREHSWPMLEDRMFEIYRSLALGRNGNVPADTAVGLNTPTVFGADRSRTAASPGPRKTE
jgi:glycosyltransferase involved in cell wall biosynthesis